MHLSPFSLQPLQSRRHLLSCHYLVSLHRPLPVRTIETTIRVPHFLLHLILEFIQMTCLFLP